MFLWRRLVIVAVIPLVPLFSHWDFSIFYGKTGLFLLALFILLPLPALVIHLLYYLNDRNRKVEINKETGSICFNYETKNECFSKNDIKSIDIFMNNGYRSAMSGYYYAKITFKMANIKWLLV